MNLSDAFGGGKMTDKSDDKSKKAEGADDDRKVIDATQKSERERFAAVTAHEAYKGREATANHLLGNTDMSAEGIIATLETMPKQSEGARNGDENGITDKKGKLSQQMQSESDAGEDVDDASLSEGDDKADQYGGKPGAAEESMKKTLADMGMIETAA